MRDGGLQKAIESVGGIGALARALGIAQPSVSNWARVPAERVLSVELLSGVHRSELRPDLYPAEARAASAEGSMTPDLDPIDRARAEEYLLLATLLRASPGPDLLARIARLAGDDSALGQAHAVLARAAGRVEADDLETEFFDLFVGVGRGEVLPYASFYLTGFLHERPLAKVREDLARLGVARAADNLDPEDHVATLMEVVAGLMLGIFEGGVEAADRFRDRHLSGWAERLMADIEKTQISEFYAAVGSLGRVFLEIEAEASRFD